MKNRHMIGALIALAPVVAIAQVATTPPPAGNAMESSTPDPEIGNVADANDPAMDTNSVDSGALADPAANVSNAEPAADPTAPEPKG